MAWNRGGAEFTRLRDGAGMIRVDPAHVQYLERAWENKGGSRTTIYLARGSAVDVKGTLTEVAAALAEATE